MIAGGSRLSNRNSRLRRVISPIQAFIGTEVSGGIALLAATGVALLWANSPWDDTYHDFLATDLSIHLGVISIRENLHGWINDGLMAVFFYVASLEIKREVLLGELAGRDKTLLPIICAAGGMLVPALIYATINVGSDTGRGWAIPMATDIAFALGVITLLGKRVPSQLRSLLLTLAIIDDIGAIAVIALFYSGDVQIESLALAAVFLSAISVMRRLGVRNFVLYLVPVTGCWIAMQGSGVHATIAGVALGFLTPVGHHKPRAETPLERIERTLHPLTSFIVVPVFALANAGISLEPGGVREAVAERVTLGVALGLVIGKPLGILTFAWLAVRTRVASLPAPLTWRHVFGMGVVAGIGFTVALFINELAFPTTLHSDDAKLAVLLGSALSGGIGYTILRITGNRSPDHELP